MRKSELSRRGFSVESDRLFDKIGIYPSAIHEDGNSYR
jgi:hypothetical protein